MKSIEEMMEIITTTDSDGGLYCNAIDEDPYDSSQWENRMPSSGYNFYENDDGTWKVTYEHFFACWDGYDSMDSEVADNLKSEYDAVKFVYEDIMLEKIQSKATYNMKEMHKRELDKILEQMKGGGKPFTDVLFLLTTELTRRGVR